MIFQELIEARELFEQGNQCLQQGFETRDPQPVAKAIACFVASIESWPELEEPYLALAYVAAAMGENTDARHLLKQVLDLNPTNVYARKQLDELASESTSPKFNAIAVSFPPTQNPA